MIFQKINIKINLHKIHKNVVLYEKADKKSNIGYNKEKIEI